MTSLISRPQCLTSWVPVSPVHIAAELHHVVQRWRPELVLVDRTGPLGKTIFEQYLVWLGWPALEGWEYNPTTKGVLMKYLQSLIEEGDVELWDEESLMREFFSIEEKRMPTSQLPQYPKPDEGKSGLLEAGTISMRLVSSTRILLSSSNPGGNPMSSTAGTSLGRNSSYLAMSLSKNIAVCSTLIRTTRSLESS